MTVSQFSVRRETFEHAGNYGTVFVVSRAALQSTSMTASSQFNVSRTLNMLLVTVRLDAGDGSVSKTSVEAALGKKIGDLPTATHESLSFSGWYTAPDGGTKVTAETIVTSDLSAIYAHYVARMYEVELNSQWFYDNRSGTDPNGKAYGISYSSNPDPNEYDGTYVSYSNFNVNSGWSKMTIRFLGYSEFVVYIRSYAESSYDYAIAGKVDQSITSNITYSDSKVQDSTRGSQTSGTSISNYKKVVYSDLDEGEHFIDIIFRKDGSVNSNQDRGYVLIPKN